MRITSELAQEVLDGMEEAAKLFSSQPAEASSNEARQQSIQVLKPMADKLKGDSGKVGVMLSGPATEEEARALLSQMQQSVLGLCSHLHVLTGGAGATLLKELKDHATAVTSAATAVVQQLQQGEGADTSLNRVVGNLWDACDRVLGLDPSHLTNKSAVFRRFTSAVRAMQDAQRELSELQEQEQLAGDNQSVSSGSEEGHQANGHANGVANTELGPGTDEGVEDGSQVEQDGDRNAGFEDDTDFQAAPLRTARERSLVAAGQKVIDVGVRLLKALMAALLRQSAALSTAASVEPWESLLWHTQTVQRGVEDMAAALIPPQEHDELQESSQAVSMSLELMLDEVPDDVAAELADSIQGLQAELEVAQQQLEALLAPSLLEEAAGNDT